MNEIDKALDRLQRAVNDGNERLIGHQQQLVRTTGSYVLSPVNTENH